MARPFDPAQVRASLDNGILTVELARARRRARRIPVDS
ncbi:MAG: Hsp20/alpha crystallin family protein [Myxococcota bacterium]